MITKAMGLLQEASSEASTGLQQIVQALQSCAWASTVWRHILAKQAALIDSSQHIARFMGTTPREILTAEAWTTIETVSCQLSARASDTCGGQMGTASLAQKAAHSLQVLQLLQGHGQAQCWATDHQLELLLHMLADTTCSQAQHGGTSSSSTVWGLPAMTQVPAT